MADLPEDDEQEQPDGDHGAVATMARYLNPDRSDKEDSGWGSMFSRVASGPRIKPPAPPAANDAAPSEAPPVSPEIKGAPGWDSAFGDQQQDQNPPGTSDAANSLGQLASATGTNGKPSHLSQMDAPPTPPTMNPDFNAAQSDLRAHSAVTPKYDPQTGKTLDKYKIGLGGRIGRALKDFGSGVLHGHGLLGSAGDVMEGAFGDRNAPGYFGRGAVNGQYSRDEVARKQAVNSDQSKIASFEDENKQADDQFKNQQSAWKDTFDVAKNEDVGAAKDETNRVRQENADEKKQHDIETEGLKQQLQDATTPEAKEQAILNARTKIADQIKLAGDDRKFYLANGKIPDDRFKAREIGIRERELQLREHDAARKAGTEDGGQWYASPKELADFKNRTSALDREASTLETQKAQLTMAGTDDDLTKKASQRIEDRLKGIAQEKDGVKQQIIGNRPSQKTKSTNTPTSTAQPKLTPIPDTSVKINGQTFTKGAQVKTKNGELKTIKGFARDDDGKFHATF